MAQARLEVALASAVSSVQVVDLSLLVLGGLVIVALALRRRFKSQADDGYYRLFLALLAAVSLCTATHVVAEVRFMRAVELIARGQFDASRSGRIDHATLQENFVRVWTAVDRSMLIAYRGAGATVKKVERHPAEVWGARSNWIWATAALTTTMLLALVLVPRWRPLRWRGWSIAAFGVVVAVANLAMVWRGAQAYFALSFAWQL